MDRNYEHRLWERQQEREEGKKMKTMKVQVSSIPKTEEEKKRWKREDELCPVCGEPFGSWKQRRLPNGIIVHKKCAS